MNISKIIAIATLLVSAQVNAGGFLGDALNSVKLIEDNAELSKAVRNTASVAAVKIERAALVQATKEDALAERIGKLEEKVRLQEEVIISYQSLVDQLKMELVELKQ